MMSVFFHFQHILILHKFFLKYEGGRGGGGQIDHPPEKITLKKPSFIKVNKSEKKLPLYFDNSHNRLSLVESS